MERLITRNVHVKYESYISNGVKVICNVKVLKYVGQKSLSRLQGQSFSINGKASSQGMYMWNMKALPIMVQKLRHISNFQIWRSKVMVKVTSLGVNGKASSQGMSCEIWQLGIIYNIGDILQIGRFSSSGDNFVSDSGDCLFIGRTDFHPKKLNSHAHYSLYLAPYNCRFQMEIQKEEDKPAFFDRCTAYLQS